jgi:amino acid adenylation domain-containing protein
MKNLEDVYPLAPIQEGMLFHTVYAPGSGAYVVHISCKIEGDFNVPVFKRTWQTILDRHPILRSAFLWEKIEKPLQAVRKELTLTWDEPDWSGLPEEQQEQQLHDYLWEDHRRGFDLGQAPLMRMSLIRLASDKYQFVWNYSHLLLDGWSVHIIFEELFSYYRAYAEGRELKLPRPRPYRDFIGWMQQQDMNKAEAFWRKSLQGFIAPTPLMGAQQAFNDAPEYLEIAVHLDQEVTAKLQAIGRQQRLTLSTFVQGAWAWLLSHYSRTDDVVFGVTVTGRPVSLRGVESVVGLLVNTLPMRVAFRADEQLLDWLKTLQDHQVEIRQYEYSSLVDVKGWSEVPRDLSLFESFVVFENHPVAEGIQELHGNLRFLSSRVFETAAYPLTVLAEPGDRMRLRIMHEAGRFDSETAARILGHIQTVLKAIATHPEQKLRDISLLSEAERHQLLVEWNRTAAEVPQRCLHELFEEQVERAPQRVAVLDKEQALTYERLNHRANQLAHYLRRMGVGPESLVAICMEPSVDTVVGLLGILKTGGSYLPLDPNYPLERLRYVLEDSGIGVLLTQEEVFSRRPMFTGIVVKLDSDHDQISREDLDNPEKLATPANRAYVLFTSGSTGKPKGVEIPHVALVNFLISMQRQPGLQPDDLLLAVTALTFDIAGLELYLPLITGARLQILSRDVCMDGNKLLKVLSSEVSVMQATPATWTSLLNAGWKGSPQLKILCGGEALTPELAKQLRERSRSVWNMYGPTETTIWSLLKSVSDVQDRVAIGRPIANTQAYVLDQEMAPVSVGGMGELYIGGTGIARGYLNRPELTAERFVPNPFGPSQGDRLYRTGDLARFKPDGDLEFLGRVDHQVKVRGYRIELGEIEVALSGCEGVAQAVVIAREDQPGEKRLVGYVVAKTAQSASSNELRGHLQGQLPDYMVPEHFVVLDSMPLTVSGKIDRRALPVPSVESSSIASYVAPRTPTEESLARIWADILMLERVGVQDDFFALGGHSLRATLMIARIRDTFQLDIPLRELFQVRTIAGLARVIERIRNEEIASGSHSLALPAIERVDREAVFVAVDEE